MSLETKNTLAKYHNVYSKKDALWDVVSQLLDLFEDTNSNFDDLFKNVPEITKDGCEQCRKFK